jgi:hypothetical protein
MTFNLTRQSLGGALVLFTFLVGLFWVRHLAAPMASEAAVAHPAPLGALIQKYTHNIEWVHAAASLVFIYMTAICITRLVTRNLVFQVRTHAFLPLLAIAGFGIFIREDNTAAVIAMFLLARGSDYFASSFRRDARPGDLFGGGLMFGLAPLFHAPTTFCLPLILVAMLVYIRSLRETLLSLVGASLPAFTWFYILWITDRKFEWPPMYYTLPEMDITQMVAAGLVATTILMSLLSFLRDARRIRTRAYRIHIYMICFLFVGLAAWHSISDLPLIAVPIGVVAASWFSRHEGIIPTLTYILTITTIIITNIFHLF